MVWVLSTNIEKGRYEPSVSQEGGQTGWILNKHTEFCLRANQEMQREKQPPCCGSEVKADCFARAMRGVAGSVLHSFLLSTRFPACAATRIPGARCQASADKGKGCALDSIPFICGHNEIPRPVLGLSSEWGKEETKVSPEACMALSDLELGAWSLQLCLVMFQAPGRLRSLPVLIAPRCSQFF